MQNTITARYVMKNNMGKNLLLPLIFFISFTILPSAFGQVAPQPKPIQTSGIPTYQSLRESCNKGPESCTSALSSLECKLKCLNDYPKSTAVECAVRCMKKPIADRSSSNAITKGQGMKRPSLRIPRAAMYQFLENCQKDLNTCNWRQFIKSAAAALAQPQTASGNPVSVPGGSSTGGSGGGSSGGGTNNPGIGNPGGTGAIGVTGGIVVRDNGTVGPSVGTGGKSYDVGAVAGKFQDAYGTKPSDPGLDRAIGTITDALQNAQNQQQGGAGQQVDTGVEAGGDFQLGSPSLGTGSGSVVTAPSDMDGDFTLTYSGSGGGTDSSGSGGGTDSSGSGGGTDSSGSGGGTGSSGSGGSDDTGPPVVDDSGGTPEPPGPSDGGGGGSMGNPEDEGGEGPGSGTHGHGSHGHGGGGGGGKGGTSVVHGSGYDPSDGWGSGKGPGGPREIPAAASHVTVIRSVSGPAQIGAGVQRSPTGVIRGVSVPAQIGAGAQPSPAGR